MPDWNTHILIGKKDGIDEEIMKEICKTIDVFHVEKIKAVNLNTLNGRFALL